MTTRKKVIIATSAMVIFSALLGFFITIDVSLQIAYARIFIDFGLGIGLVAIVLAFISENPLPTEALVHAISKLKQGKYGHKIELDKNCELSPVALALNELALSLQKKAKDEEEIKRSLREELLPNLKNNNQNIDFNHSYHPELGPVISIAHDEQISKDVEEKTSKKTDLKESILPSALSNTLIQSKPPLETKSLAPKHEKQDLDKLYEDFISAQKSLNATQIDYPLFLSTIEETTKNIKEKHHCDFINFEVVVDKNQVALQPRIIS